MSDSETHAALVRRLLERTIAEGSIVLPAVPSLLDEYTTICDQLFRTLGVVFSAAERERLEAVLAEQLAIAFDASPRSQIVITYQAPVGSTLTYHVKPQWVTLEDAYDSWVAEREPPLFGTQPDARVWSLAHATADPASFPILDLGAGTGRNALALARRGHPVDAVEFSPMFVEQLRRGATNEQLNMRILQRDFLVDRVELRDDYALIVLSEVVTDFRSTDQLHKVFSLAAQCLAPSGRLVMSVFLPKEGASIEIAARELGQQCYSSIFTWAEIDAARAGLPLVLENVETVAAYEPEHLPDGAWPPTAWYERWIHGQDVFSTDPSSSPIALHWLVFRHVP